MMNKHPNRFVGLMAGMIGGLAASGPAAAAQGSGIAAGITRAEIAGIDVIIYPTGVQDVVTVTGSMPAGDVFADGNIAVPTLTGMMLDRGTQRQDKFAIARQLEKVGASIRFGVSDQMLNIGARSLKKDIGMVIDLMAEQLRMPAFADTEFETAKKQLAGSMRQAMDDTGHLAGEALARAIFPQGHPNRPHTAEEYLQAIPKATLEEVREFHRRHYGPEHMTLVFVGDVDIDTIRTQVARAFDGWKGGVAVRRATSPARAPDKAQDLAVQVPGKASVSVMIGQPTGLACNHPDAQALRVATAILGSGFTGRLMGAVRDREGLTYGIGASVGDDTFNDGTWSITATFAPELLEKGIASTRRELLKWWKEGVTAQELAARKTNLIGRYQVSLATTNGLANAILQAVHCGYGLDWLDEYPKVIESLTLEQVNAAIRRYLDPEKMVLVKAGTLMSGN